MHCLGFFGSSLRLEQGIIEIGAELFIALKNFQTSFEVLWGPRDHIKFSHAVFLTCNVISSVSLLFRLNKDLLEGVGRFRISFFASFRSFITLAHSAVHQRWPGFHGLELSRKIKVLFEVERKDWIKKL